MLSARRMKYMSFIEKAEALIYNEMQGYSGHRLKRPDPTGMYSI